MYKKSNRALLFILFIDPEKRIFWSFQESELKILAPYSSIECWYLVEGKIAESWFVDLVLAMVSLILIFIIFVSGLLCWVSEPIWQYTLFMISTKDGSWSTDKSQTLQYINKYWKQLRFFRVKINIVCIWPLFYNLQNFLSL